MLKTKRVALSLRVSEHARDALTAKAEREGHRYPLTLAATLLERALAGEKAPAPGGDWLSDVRAFARLFGGMVTTQNGTIVLVLEPATKEAARDWIVNRINKHAPPPAGVDFVVQIAGVG